MTKRGGGRVMVTKGFSFHPSTVARLEAYLADKDINPSAFVEGTISAALDQLEATQPTEGAAAPGASQNQPPRLSIK